MVQLYQNATPDMKFTGYKDTPKAGAQSGAAVTPLFCPLSLARTAWGSTEDAYLIAGDEFESIFGSDSWEIRGKYFTHSNLFARMFQQKAIRHFIQRLELPGMAKGKARLSLEVVEFDVPQYLRGTDGKYMLDANGDLQQDTTTPTMPGYKIRLRTDVDTDGTMVIGGGAQAAGTLVGKDGAVSTVYPIMDFEGTFFGERANRFNINIHQPKTTAEVAVDSKSIESIGNMIYRFSVTETPIGGGTKTPWYTRLSNEQMDFSLVADAINANGAMIGFGENYSKSYTLKGQSYNGANVTGPVDNSFVYSANVELVATMLHKAELAALGYAFIDETNVNSINLFGDTDHKSVPYHTVVMAPVAELEPETYLSGELSTFNLGGGNDGDMSETAYEEAVALVLDTFGAGAITHLDKKRYPFHFMFDSGFSVDVKKKFQALKAKRPDLFVGIGTHTHGNTPLTLLDELAVMSQLASNAGLYPESTIYKTEATRSCICPWAIRLATTDANADWTHPTTLMYDLAGKMAEYWGSSDQVWVKNKAFDTYPNNVIKHELLNYQYADISVREEMWGKQAIAVEYSDVNEIIYSGLQTVNPNDSSVLNSIVAVGGTIHATWACIRANSHFVGRNMAASVLIADSNELVAKYCKGIDASKVQVVPDTIITEEDNDAGYAWTTQAHTTSGGMRTVNTIIVTSGYSEE